MLSLAKLLPSVRRSDAPTLRRSDAPTLRRSDAPTLRRSDAPTLRRSDASGVKQSGFVVKAIATLSLGIVFALPAAAEPIYLTGEMWTISGIDDSGVSWDSSLLQFTSQTPSGSDFVVEGYFDWFSNDIYSGREVFSGTFAQDLTLDITGFELINPINLALGNYTAHVTEDGRAIINGTWGPPPGGSVIPGVWSAVRASAAAPEPSVLALLLPGVVMGVGLVRRRKA